MTIQKQHEPRLEKSTHGGRLEDCPYCIEDPEPCHICDWTGKIEMENDDE